VLPPGDTTYSIKITVRVLNEVIRHTILKMEVVEQLTSLLTSITKIINKGLYNFKNESHKATCVLFLTFVFKTA